MSSFRWILLVFVLFVACKKEAKESPEIAKIQIEIDVDRFEEKFYKTDFSNLELVKKEYPFMFPKSIHDSIWVQKIENKQEQFLFEESQRLHGDLGEFKIQLNQNYATYSCVRQKKRKFKIRLDVNGRVNVAQIHFGWLHINKMRKDPCRHIFTSSLIDNF